MLLCAQVHVCVCACSCLYRCPCVCVHTYTYSCVYTCICSGACVCVHTCVEVRGQSQVLLLGTSHLHFAGEASSWPQTHPVGSAGLTNSDSWGTDLSLLPSGTAISSFSFFKIFNLWTCVCLCWYAHVCVCGGGKKVLGPLELAFHT